MRVKRCLPVVAVLALCGPAGPPAAAQQICEPSTTTGHSRPNDILTGIFYYAWHAASPPCAPDSETKWCRCVWRDKPGDPRALLGLYDAADAAVVAQHMDWMVDYGVDVVGLEWDNNPPERAALENVVIPAIESRDLQFVLLYDMGIRLKLDKTKSPHTIDFSDDDNQRLFIEDFTDFATSASYFRNPKYLKFKNRPVVYVYISHAIIGNPSDILNTFNAAHAAARAAPGFFDGLYIVADHLWWEGTKYWMLELMDAKAVTSFGPIANDTLVNPVSPRPIRQWADHLVEGLYKAALRRLPELGLIDLMPGVFIQYDDRSVSPPCLEDPGRKTRYYHLEDGEDWRYMLRNAGVRYAFVAERTEIDNECRETVTRNADESIVWIYSFNEWGEGAGLEPLEDRAEPYPYGFGFEPLQIMKEVMDAGWVDPPGVPCGEMGPGWYEANQASECRGACDAECLTKWDCGGQDCYSPATGLNYCLKCPTTPVCGDLFCARGKGEHCYSCPQDCPCDGKTCGEMGLGWYYPDQEGACREVCDGECLKKLDCDGKPCLAPHLGESYCWKCPQMARCGDGACQPGAGEGCDTCPGDCGPCVTPRTCGEMGLGWYEANEIERCAGDCDGACQAKHDCGGQPCYSPATGLGYCLNCPHLARCGDGACQPAKGESCGSCPNDCGSCDDGGGGGDDPGDGGGGTNTCESQGWHPINDFEQCNSECGRECVRKQDCGGRACEGGYCWKCP